MPSLRNHTHCQVAQKSPHTNQNLSKSMAAPTHGLIAKIKHGHTTFCIFNCGFSVNSQRHNSHQLYVYLERETSRNPQCKHTIYRYLQGEERETVEHKLKILILELKLIINKLTNWKNFVFADPLLPFGTIREASAQTTHAEDKPARVVLSFTQIGFYKNLY